MPKAYNHQNKTVHQLVIRSLKVGYIMLYNVRIMLLFCLMKNIIRTFSKTF